MSDSTDDRRHRGGRGSLLDHANDTGVSAGEQPIDPQVPGRSLTGAAPSILSAPSRSARVSTSRLADFRHARPERASDPAPASASAKDVPSPAAVPRVPEDATEPVSPGREKFGDRIARLIGTITPDEKPEPLHPQTREQQPAGQGAPDQAGPHPDHASLQSAEPERAQSPYPRADRYSRDDQQPRDDHYHWHAASSGGQFTDDTRPLLDASILISAVWRFRRLIGAATVAGAVVGVLMALSTPHKYYAEARLFVDPREIRVTDDDIRNQQLSTEAMLAITDSQLQILSSTSVLEKVIVDLGLDRDPEFNGSLASGGISGGLSLIKQLVTGKTAADEGEQNALNSLRDALYVFRDAKTFVIIVGVDTRDAEKSALIANQIVETYLDSEGQAQSNLLERTSESIDTRINSLRSDLDAAEREVERFKAENGLVGVGGQYIDDKVILALSDQLGNARAMKVGIRVKADNLARVNINDVLSGAFPEELLSANLSELRKQYTQTKSNAESLATQLGPRHPQYIAAMQSLETITNEISAELRRIVASSQTELQRAVETEQELASQMAIAKSRAMDQSVELVTLRELERKANATRGIYEAFLTRSRETSERSNLSTRNVRVISPAEAPIQPMGPSRKIIAIGGMMAGLFAGLGLALLVGAVESIRAYNSAQSQNRYPGSPFGGYPQPPAPGPRTPPGGPGRHVRPRPNEDMFGGHDTAAGELAPGPYSGARASAAAGAHAHAKTAPGDDRSGKPEPIRVEPEIATLTPSEPVRTGFLRPKSTRAEPPAKTSSTAESSQTAPAAPVVKPQRPAAEQAPRPAWLQAAAEILAEADDHAAQDGERRLQPTSAVEASRMQVTGQGTATSSNAQAAAPAPASVAPSDPRTAQPAWQAYPAQPAWQAYPAQAQTPYQPQPQFHPYAHPGFQTPAQVMYPNPPSFYPAYQPLPPQVHPSHLMPMGDPYALGHPGYPAPAGQYAPAPAYAAPQPHMVSPQFHPGYPPQPSPVPLQQQYYAAPTHPAQPQPVPTAPQAQVVPAAEPTPSASNEQVDRIRREMNELRSRIDGYAAPRRSA